MTARKRVGGFYVKPLIGNNIQTDPEKVLKELKSELKKRLRAKLTLTTFSEAARKRIAKSMQIKIMPNSLVVTTNFPGFFPLVQGQRKQQMTWLTKAKSPIPIVLDNGDVIFRNATPQSMQNGSWWHPGRAQSNFIEKAKEEARKFIRERLAKELIKQLRDSLKKR